MVFPVSKTSKILAITSSQRQEKRKGGGKKGRREQSTTEEHKRGLNKSKLFRVSQKNEKIEKISAARKEVAQTKNDGSRHAVSLFFKLNSNLLL